MLEVETKFKLDDRNELLRRLEFAGAREGGTERHEDTYFRHPCRNFVETKEALRIRSIDSVASITYKGPKLPVGDSALKARQEIEWCLAPGDSDGDQMEQLLLALGFTKVTTVRKQRQSFSWPDEDEQHHGFTMTIDQVDHVGLFAEIELLVADESPSAVKAAGERIDSLAETMGLTQSVRESYLTMLVNKLGLE